ncbi:ricin-type beta-trefoil lectin domain protein [Streptomyces sp. NPDC002889]|uniref:ricin-type beta-trefoil lectin domain protein n=1 Tax=Streptomyces sp. NPDC002889 TaxID=3364669 RepID=UPI003677B723
MQHPRMPGAAPYVQPSHTPGVSDEELAAALGSSGGTREAHPVATLLARHWQSVFDYASICSPSSNIASMLTTAAFAQLMENLACTGASVGALRPHLLVTTRHIAKAWACDERVAALLTGLLIPELPPENRQLISRAFYSMPLTAQVLLWHAEVEGEGISVPAALLGMDPRIATDQLEQAREQFRQACVRAHRESAPGHECRHFNRLLDVSLRRGGALIPDIQQHLASCRHCRYAADQLRQSGGRLGRLLAEALLGRAAQPYLDSRPGRNNARAQARTTVRATGRHSRSGRARALPRIALRSKRAAMTASPRVLVAGTAVAVTGLLALGLVASAWSDEEEQAGPVVPSGAVAKPSATAPAPGTGTGRPSGTAPQPSATSAAHPDVPLSTRLRNVESGLCLDVPTGAPEPGTDVTMATCSSAPAQRWVYERDGRVRSAQAPELCLNSHELDGIVVLGPCTTPAAPDAADVRYDLTIQGQVIPRWNDGLALIPASPEPQSPVVVKVRDDSAGQIWATDAVHNGTKQQSGTDAASPYAEEVNRPAPEGGRCVPETCPQESPPVGDDAAPASRGASVGGAAQDHKPADAGLRRVSDGNPAAPQPRTFERPAVVPAPAGRVVGRVAATLTRVPSPQRPKAEAAPAR